MAKPLTSQPEWNFDALGLTPPPPPTTDCPTAATALPFHQQDYEPSPQLQTFHTQTQHHFPPPSDRIGLCHAHHPTTRSSPLEPPSGYFPISGPLSATVPYHPNSFQGVHDAEITTSPTDASDSEPNSWTFSTQSLHLAHAGLQYDSPADAYLYQHTVTGNVEPSLDNHHHWPTQPLENYRVLFIISSSPSTCLPVVPF